jgi:rhomboid protease GluP
MTQPCPRCGAPLPPVGTERCPTCGVLVYTVPARLNPAAVRLAEFGRTLFTLTPRVVVTWVVVAVNVGVFVLMTASGVSPTQPTVPDLLRWGADFGPAVLGGEWWRPLTSTFVHIGLVHILVNMWVLANAGPMVERMVGNAGFLILYLVSGLCGSLTSLAWHPLTVSAGASGAVFGVYGALLGVLARDRGSVPVEALAKLRSSGIAFVGYNVLFGLMIPFIDNAAHLGGLAGGFVCGLVLGQPFVPDAVRRRPVRNALAAALGAALITGGVVVNLALNADLGAAERELSRTGEVERTVLARYYDAVARSERGDLTPQAMAEVVERDVLPEWRAQRERLEAVKNLPPAYRDHVAAVLAYMRLQEESWELTVQAARTDDAQKGQEAVEKQKQADAAAERIGAKSK